MTNPVGRPSKYSAAYCTEVIGHMQEGASLTSFAAEIGVSRATLNVWMGEYPEFLEAANVGKAKCAAWWEKAGRNIALGGGGPGASTLAVFGMKNMGADDWKDKTETDVNVKGDLAATIAQRRAKVAERDPA